MSGGPAPFWGDSGGKIWSMTSAPSVITGLICLRCTASITIVGGNPDYLEWMGDESARPNHTVEMPGLT